MKIEITLTLSTPAQLEALQAAMEIYVDMETDRSKDGESGFNQKANSSDMRRLEGARQIVALLNGKGR